MFAFASHSIPWSSPCRMHELSVLSDFLDLFINFTFSSSSSLISSTSSCPSTSLRLGSKIHCAHSPRRWGLMTTTSPLHRLEVGSSIMRLVGFRGFIGNTERMCCTHGPMNSRMRNVCDGQMSLFLGWRARILRFRGTRGTSGLCKTLFEDS